MIMVWKVVKPFPPPTGQIYLRWSSQGSDWSKGWHEARKKCKITKEINLGAISTLTPWQETNRQGPWVHILQINPEGGVHLEKLKSWKIPIDSVCKGACICLVPGLRPCLCKKTKWFSFYYNNVTVVWPMNGHVDCRNQERSEIKSRKLKICSGLCWSAVLHWGTTWMEHISRSSCLVADQFHHIISISATQ